MATESYILHTLFDITNTEILRGYPSLNTDFFDRTGKKISDEKKWYYSRNQQRNWETIIQLLCLRIQPIINRPTKLDNQSVRQFGFDSVYGDIASVWRVKFSTDTSDAFRIDNNPVGLLLSDFDRIPMITGLQETSLIDPPYFITNMPGINITFTKLDE